MLRVMQCARFRKREISRRSCATSVPAWAVLLARTMAMFLDFPAMELTCIRVDHQRLMVRLVNVATRKEQTVRRVSAAQDSGRGTQAEADFVHLK